MSPTSIVLILKSMPTVERGAKCEGGVNRLWCVSVVRKNREAGRQGQRAASAGTVVPTSAGCKHRAWPPDRNTANTTCPLRAHPRGGREPRPPQRQSRQWGEPLTDGGDVARGKLVVGETEEEATFTDATVADQQQLDQVVVLGRHWEGRPTTRRLFGALAFLTHSKMNCF